MKGKERLYSIWHNMKSRCYYAKKDKFEHYGGRGINVCDEWKRNFNIFYNWALCNGYADDLTLDRINTNGNYEPSNCRWVDSFVQANNTSKNRFVEYNGEIKTVAEWARIFGIHRCVLNARLKRGWSFEKSVITPPRNYKKG